MINVTDIVFNSCSSRLDRGVFLSVPVDSNERFCVSGCVCAAELLSDGSDKDGAGGRGEESCGPRHRSAAPRPQPQNHTGTKHTPPPADSHSTSTNRTRFSNLFTPEVLHGPIRARTCCLRVTRLRHSPLSYRAFILQCAAVLVLVLFRSVLSE